MSANATGELLRARLGTDDVSAELARLVTEKAEGNPLFAEEIVNYLSERGEITEGAVAAGDAEAIIPELERLKMVHEGERGGYIFKHTLIQDAVHDSLFSDKCATLHERVADVMEQKNEHRLGEIAETLAHHYGQTARTEKAVRYMAEAGEKSLMVLFPG